MMRALSEQMAVQHLLGVEGKRTPQRIHVIGADSHYQRDPSALALAWLGHHVMLTDAKLLDELEYPKSQEKYAGFVEAVSRREGKTPKQLERQAIFSEGAGGCVHHWNSIMKFFHDHRSDLDARGIGFQVPRIRPIDAKRPRHTTPTFDGVLLRGSWRFIVSLSTLDYKPDPYYAALHNSEYKARKWKILELITQNFKAIKPGGKMVLAMCEPEKELFERHVVPLLDKTRLRTQFIPVNDSRYSIAGESIEPDYSYTHLMVIQRAAPEKSARANA